MLPNWLAWLGMEVRDLTCPTWISVALGNQACIKFHHWDELICVSVVWFILSDALRVKPNTKCLTHFLPLRATKGFKRNRNSCYQFIRRIVSRKIQANPLNLRWVYFEQSCMYQLINNFTKNEHYLRSAWRVLPLF